MHGRAGRENLPGKVIIQTYNPDNFSIQDARKQDYGLFYETEIALRKQLKYPPFCDIIVMRFDGKDEKEMKTVSLEMYLKIQEKIEKTFSVFKPMPSPIDKIQNRFRWRIIIKGNMNENTNEMLNQILKEAYNQNMKDLRITIDVNPNNMI